VVRARTITDRSGGTLPNQDLASDDFIEICIVSPTLRFGSKIRKSRICRSSRPMSWRRFQRISVALWQFRQ